jgi:hypothetical protein
MLPSARLVRPPSAAETVDVVAPGTPFLWACCVPGSSYVVHHTPGRTASPPRSSRTRAADSSAVAPPDDIVPSGCSGSDSFAAPLCVPRPDGWRAGRRRAQRRPALRSAAGPFLGWREDLLGGRPSARLTAHAVLHVAVAVPGAIPIVPLAGDRAIRFGTVPGPSRRAAPRGAPLRREEGRATGCPSGHRLLGKRQAPDQEHRRPLAQAELVTPPPDPQQHAGGGKWPMLERRAGALVAARVARGAAAGAIAEGSFPGQCAGAAGGPGWASQQ